MAKNNKTTFAIIFVEESDFLKRKRLLNVIIEGALTFCKLCKAHIVSELLKKHCVGHFERKKTKSFHENGSNL